ncbi:hypothetical protein [Halobacterium sp. CBA1126]|uniref:hypothetical protein n=1 Tax=Halobacterium sp. CBA1126 TaxID=2668074 RepID=UPI0012FA652A|nr:hypothetical protein [Halobacterium sp. CBA1126]MUV59784.1 hypothetical protein [Halobacterium sp. CBA1126]
MEQRIVGLVFVAILLMAGIGIAQSGFQTAVTEGQPGSTVHEQWTVNTGEPVSLSESNRDNVVYQAATDVSVTADNQTVAQSGNWTWNRHNGTIVALAGGTLSDGETANITYGYAEPSNEQSLAKETMMFVPGTLGDVLILVLGIALLLGAFVVMARSGGGL